ncbi:MAG: DUF1385 domain-containing protein [Desulfovibrionaceae bacterium]|nr:DUF1385 domain-containing protein [Desulfovibrionaceae bacterium]
MRAKDRLSVAVRMPDGSITVQSMPWFSLTRSPVLQKPFMRGFPVLLETMVNGIKTLNLSARLTGTENGEEIKSWHLALTLICSIGMALVLFVVLPHLFSVGMQWLGISGGLNSISFHAWDGLFKFSLFIGYIAAISLLPDIYRVFQYHGAEHKTIWAYERSVALNARSAMQMSRLHPRCGTTFLLFVLSIAILLHTIAVPLALMVWTPENPVLKHTLVICFKLLLMIPISSLAYELIKFSSRINHPLLGGILKSPGLLLQLLTTREPDESQMEVALVALKEALYTDAPEIDTPVYQCLEEAAC